jgi:hypothetical protein
MNQASLLTCSRKAHRLLLASLVSLPLLGACSDDEETVAPPVDLTLTITSLDGADVDSAAPLRCDGTLAVQVAIAPGTGFTLRPRYACGNSERCGYVHVEALDGRGELLASVDSVTTTGLLELDDRLPSLAQITAVLLRGTDGTPVLNADESEVSTSIDLERPVPEGCDTIGAGGTSGLGGAPPQGGEGGGAGAAAGGAPAGGTETGGAAGSTETAGAGGGGSEDPSAGSGGI